MQALRLLLLPGAGVNTHTRACVGPDIHVSTNCLPCFTLSVYTHLVVVADHPHPHAPLVRLDEGVCDLVARDGEHTHIQRALRTTQQLQQPAHNSKQRMQRSTCYQRPCPTWVRDCCESAAKELGAVPSSRCKALTWSDSWPGARRCSCGDGSWRRGGRAWPGRGRTAHL